MKKKRRLRSGRRGYIVVEAAILVPVFLFAIVLLAYILQILHFQEIIHFEAARNLADLSWESQIGGSGFSERMYGTRTYHDTQKKIRKDIDIQAVITTDDEVYEADIRYPLWMKLPFGLFDDFLIRDCLAARKWSGADSENEALPFSAMETDEDAYVFIFPRYGERYHRGNCFYLTRDAGQYFICVPLSEAQSAGKYTPCAVCY